MYEAPFYCLMKLHGQHFLLWSPNTLKVKLYNAKGKYNIFLNFFIFLIYFLFLNNADSPAEVPYRT